MAYAMAVEKLAGIEVPERAHFVRSIREMARLVRKRRVLNAAGRTQVVCIGAAGRAATYVSYQIGPTPWEQGVAPNAVRVVEFAGSRWALLHALGRLMDDHGVDSLELHYAHCDAEIAAMAHSLGWPTDPRPFRGTVGIINAGAFWQACAALFRERLGDEAFERLGFTVEAGVAHITCGAERVDMPDMEALTGLVFAHPTMRQGLSLGLAEGSELERALRSLFPMPLVNYGLTYH